MVEQEGRGTVSCPRCGGSGCASCSRSPAPQGFLLLRGGGELVEPMVRLVREYKGPTVRDVLQADPQDLELLPGRVRAMAMALDEADLPEAERRIDRALGSLLPGPVRAARPCRRRLRLLLACGAGLALLGVLGWILAGG